MTATNSLVRLVVISDTHGQHNLFPEPLPSGDILIHCGDFANRGNVEDVRNFVQWLDAQTCCPHKIVIQGNHDRNRHDKADNRINLKTEFEQANNSTHLLLDATVTVAGVTIHGASWDSCETGNFTKVPRHNNIDILLAHKHPYITDKNMLVPGSSKKSLRAWKGSKALTKTVLKGRIPLCCSGHVHWGRGVVSYQRKFGKKKHKSVFVNAASLQSSSSSSNGPRVWPPVVIDYNLKDRVVVSVDCPY